MVTYVFFVASFSIFILVRLHFAKNSSSGRSKKDGQRLTETENDGQRLTKTDRDGQRQTKTDKDEFQRLVAVVAIVYCVCDTVNAIRQGGMFFSLGESKLYLVSAFSTRLSMLINSSFNLIIYLLFSSNFRNTALSVVQKFLRARTK